jgi:hypothetical protein
MNKFFNSYKVYNITIGFEESASNFSAFVFAPRKLKMYFNEIARHAIIKVLHSIGSQFLAQRAHSLALFYFVNKNLSETVLFGENISKKSVAFSTR